MLIRHLPADSAVQREIHGEAAEWTVTDHLLAAAIDHLAVSNWMFASVNTSEDDDPPEPPKPVPRPGSADEDEEEGDDAGEAGSRAGNAEEAVSPGALARFFG